MFTARQCIPVKLGWSSPEPWAVVLIAVTAFLVCERVNVRHAGRLAVHGVNPSQEDSGTTEMSPCLLSKRTVGNRQGDWAEEVAGMEVGQLGSLAPRQLCWVK